MFKNYKKLVLLITIFIFLLFGGQSVFALEVKYFSLPMVGNPEYCTGEGCLGMFVSWWFTLGIYIAGILALISFTIGAIGLINPNPESHNDAKDRMKGSILGLVLTLSALVILQTINPQFIKPTLTPLPGVAGIFYMKDPNNLLPAPMAEKNVANVPEGFKRIYYKCDYNEKGGYDERAPGLFIWKFPKPGLEKGNDINSSGITVTQLTCGRDTSVGTGSFRMAFETPGVYYFLGKGCSGYMSDANTTTQDRIAEPFVGKIKSIRITNSAENKYGIIFHNKPNVSDGSDCTIPIFAASDVGGGCEDLSMNIVADIDKAKQATDFSAFSAEIFQHRYSTDSSSGDGVWLYGNVNGWDSGNKSGVFYASDNELRNFLGKRGSYFNLEAEKLVFDYTGVPTNLAKTCKETPSCREPGADPNNCCFCATPKDWSARATSVDEESGCGGSIQIGGDYLVTLYTIYTDTKDGKSKWFCQSFNKDTPNLSTANSARPGGAEIDNISIISTK